MGYLLTTSGDRFATITNSGQREGTEVYVQLPHASGEHFRRLAGWQRVPLKIGESKIVLEPLSFASFDERKDAWQWLAGDYTVLLVARHVHSPCTAKQH
jgi:hypothetical protein